MVATECVATGADWMAGPTTWGRMMRGFRNQGGSKRGDENRHRAGGKNPRTDRFHRCWGPSLMHISSLYIDNVGPFDELSFDFNRQVNVLLGPNNTGKSTTLWALAEILVYPFSFRGNYCVLT